MQELVQKLHARRAQLLTTINPYTLWCDWWYGKCDQTRNDEKLVFFLGVLLFLSLLTILLLCFWKLTDFGAFVLLPIVAGARCLLKR